MKCSPAVGAATAPSVAGVERLVIGAVALVRRAPSGDIGRQRHLAEALDRLVEESAGKREAEHDLAALPSLLDLGVEAHELAGGAFGGLAEADAVADGEALCRPREGAPALGALALVQQHLDTGRGFAPRPQTVQARRDHLGVVEDEHVARPQEVRKIAHGTVLEPRLAVRSHREQTRRIARGCRPKRDPLVGQVEIEQVDAHAAPAKGRDGFGGGTGLAAGAGKVNAQPVGPGRRLVTALRRAANGQI